MNLKISKTYSKSALALILATLLLSSAAISVASGFITGQSAVGPKYADYLTIEGVGSNDDYDSRQYSYDINQWAHDYEMIPGYPSEDPDNNWFTADKTLRWGMTEFGEFATPAHTGIAYGANSAEWANTESWASTAINAALYIQGWVFYMNYTRAGVARCIESYAIYSDLSAVEAGRMTVSWVGTQFVNSTTWSPTVGTITANGIEVIYDSARLAVARANVIITDGYYNEAVAKITFTVVMNKDTKYAIVYKDIKLLIDPKVLDVINDLAFSERYEIDLARNVNPSNQAFIHWFEDYNTTVYQHPLTGDTVFDVLQAFDPAKQYIYFAAYWPNCTEFSVYSPLVPDLTNSLAANRYTRVLDQGFERADIPAPANEPNTPWVIAQWRYQSWNPTGLNYYPDMLAFLAKSAQREIRFVEVAGMTDYNKPTTPSAASVYTSAETQFNAKDINATNAYNSVDTEVRFLLANVFNPQSLGNTLETAADDPFLWIGLGQSAATTDSAGAAVLSDFGNWAHNEPLGLFDRNDTAFPWTAPTAQMAGTIPFGLDWTGNYAGYSETFSNVAKGTGTDATAYMRTGLVGFVFKTYDGVLHNPQPVSGGLSSSSTYWYPSKNPLDERWTGPYTSMAEYYPAEDNGIITLGGMKANGLTRYFNDFGYAITREGTTNSALLNGGSVTGSAPTSNSNIATLDYYPISTWASSLDTFGYKAGYAVISIARDINGTRGLSVYGWDGRDTYWAAAWASQFLNTAYNDWIPEGTVAVIINIAYSGADHEPIAFTVVKALGTITEFGTNKYTTDYSGFDTASMSFSVGWTDSVGLSATSPTLPTNQYGSEWWYAKLPTISTASVQYDP